MKPVADYFKNSGLLHHALTHRSYCNEHPGEKSNERLEFLGDAVLSLIISRRLFDLFPDLPEGDLTLRRSHLVQTSTLARKSVLLRLDQLLLLSRGEEDSGGRKNTGLLANTFEAVLGAIYLDSGLETCREFLSEIFPDSEITSYRQTKDPKSLLQELAQDRDWGTPTYHTVSASGPDHAKKFVISVTINNHPEATGEGTSKQRAETAAASNALSRLFPDVSL
ncbi:MAG: Ribonuclease 3 [Candidatus Amesbacteria bacterium GW2011_GWB1_47_19]|nr:MAG: Ribonuclease 3 [Candidatus Amesbacteria bacterium GW2011_GWA1_44_24]KKU31095.1 MAG: Ribonuclease 3 [Candidatus Amesbacteria bacterium GW2011_GWC1_46_24]KKU67216.1 MAG: Ribonuclease 3 [Candidatus Amesbacteria bacterium GW2011_GWB1_47_19]HBC72632.1 ribonuclease III [Candidatus Amesbacteria bacterium]